MGRVVVVCQNCGAVNQDPGGNISRYWCGVCGQQALKRMAQRNVPPSEAAGAAGGAVLGGLLGLLLAPGIGWLVGAALGGLVGASETRGREQERRRKRKQLP